MNHDDLPYVVAVDLTHGRRLGGLYIKSYYHEGEKFHQIYAFHQHHHLSAKDYRIEYPNRSKLKFI